MMNENKFKREYLNPFPDTLLSWLEGFCMELNAEKPSVSKYTSTEEFCKRLGAWETQEIIRKKLLYAISVEKRKLGE